MISDHDSIGLRDRARRAMQRELVEIAQQLFVANGYEATTVDAIATAAGMSRRSFFRYFGSKEELVLGKYEQMGESLVERLNSRPADEPLWTSLRVIFDYFVQYSEDAELQAKSAELDRVINASDSLRAGYLERMQRIQDSIVEAARQRAQRQGSLQGVTDPSPRAIVGSAFTCVAAASESTLSGKVTFRESLDRAMNAVAQIGAAKLVR